MAARQQESRGNNIEVRMTSKVCPGPAQCEDST